MSNSLPDTRRVVTPKLLTPLELEMILSKQFVTCAGYGFAGESPTRRCRHTAIGLIAPTNILTRKKLAASHAARGLISTS